MHFVKTINSNINIQLKLKENIFSMLSVLQHSTILLALTPHTFFFLLGFLICFLDLNICLSLKDACNTQLSPLLWFQILALVSQHKHYKNHPLCFKTEGGRGRRRKKTKTQEENKYGEEGDKPFQTLLSQSRVLAFDLKKSFKKKLKIKNKKKRIKICYARFELLFVSFV